MNQLDTAITAIPVWITLTALALGLVLGWAATATVYARRVRARDRTIADQAEADRAHAEATHQMVHRLGLDLGLDSSGDLTAVAEAVAEPRPYDPAHDVLSAEWQPHPPKDRKGGAHRAQ